MGQQGDSVRARCVRILSIVDELVELIFVSFLASNNELVIVGEHGKVYPGSVRDGESDREREAGPKADEQFVIGSNDTSF